MRQECREIWEANPFSVFFHETKGQMEQQRDGASREEQGTEEEWALCWGGLHFEEFLGF